MIKAAFALAAVLGRALAQEQQVEDTPIGAVTSSKLQIHVSMNELELIPGQFIH